MNEGSCVFPAVLMSVGMDWSAVIVFKPWPQSFLNVNQVVFVPKRNKSQTSDVTSASFSLEDLLNHTRKSSSSASVISWHNDVRMHGGFQSSATSSHGEAVQVVNDAARRRGGELWLTCLKKENYPILRDGGMQRVPAGESPHFQTICAINDDIIRVWQWSGFKGGFPLPAHTLDSNVLWGLLCWSCFHWIILKQILLKTCSGGIKWAASEILTGQNTCILIIITAQASTQYSCVG